MNQQIFSILLLPFLGTVLGAFSVFFIGDHKDSKLQQRLSGFSAGVMTAAAVWSLLLPALEQSKHLGVWAFLPAAGGLWAGFLFLLVVERLVARLYHTESSLLSMILAVTLHNLPEGMAVGVVAVGWLCPETTVTTTAALMLALGIGLQNLPEGAIISLPLRRCGMKTGAAFGCGVLSGIVEPIGTVLTLSMAAWIVPWLPWLLGFSAGTMLYVVVLELIPEACSHRGYTGGAAFLAGFSLMMLLDVLLG